jgi:hypothetical protein
MIGMATKPHDGLARDIQDSQSAYIIGFFLDEGQTHNVDNDYREAAMTAAARFIKDPATDSATKKDLLNTLEVIAEAYAKAKDNDDLQQEAKELLISLVDDDVGLSEIALDEDEDADNRVKAIERMTDKNLLLDVAADSEDDEVRQAAKNRIKELKS